MIILPLELDLAEISSVAELRKCGVGHILALPYSVEPTVLLVCMELDPVISLVPCHSDLFKIVQEVN